MSDEELLRYAAKAMEYVEPHSYRPKTNCLLWVGKESGAATWRPFHDNAEAFEMMVKLGIDVTFDDIEVQAFPPDGIGGFCEMVKENNDPYAATRRAIVKAAAEIGKVMTLGSCYDK